MKKTLALTTIALTAIGVAVRAKVRNRNDNTDLYAIDYKPTLLLRSHF